MSEQHKLFQNAMLKANAEAGRLESENERLRRKIDKFEAGQLVPNWMKPGTVDDVIAVQRSSSISEVCIQFRNCGDHVTRDVRDWIKSVVGAGNA